MTWYTRRRRLHPDGEGLLYLVAIMDWHSPCVLAWRLSNTMDISFCLEAVEDALGKGRPEIFNTDQGAQFTSAAFTDKLEAAGVRISMGPGGAGWTTSLSRLWRSLKYEEVHLKAYAAGLHLRQLSHFGVQAHGEPWVALQILRLVQPTWP